MRLKPTKPTKLEGDNVMGDSYEHPSYGMIRYGRISGHATLVGSDLKHQHFMGIEISTAVKNRNLSEDVFYSRSPILKINMSEHQWASFIASPNTGGVACTIDRRPDPEAKMIGIAPPEEDNKHDLALEELKESTANITEGMRRALHSLEKMLEGKTISKVKLREHVAKLDRLVGSISSGLPFHVSQHKEMMEKNVQSAKSEVEGYVTGMVTRMGMESLKDVAPKFIESKKEEDQKNEI